MGIRGLYSYIQNHADAALEWHKLQNCNVVIDGNNLAYEIYNNSPGINSAYGGDYDTYAIHVEQFFEKLFKCKVVPVVVMDGGYPLQRNKFETVYSRLTLQLEACVKVNPDNQDSMKIFPIMGRSVFVSAAQKLGVKVIQSDFEADDDIVVVARKLGAYVLSNDSDFYISNIPFILLHSINMKQMQKEKRKDGTANNFIPCYRFDVDTFCSITGLRKELLPLLAAILGNDFMNTKAMIPFYNTISHLRPVSAYLTQRQKVIISVVKWLAKQNEEPEDILEKVINLRCLSLSNRMEQCMRTVFEMYSPEDSSLCSWISSHKRSCPLRSGGVVSSTGPRMDFTRDWFPSSKVLSEFECICNKRSSNEIVSFGHLPSWFIRGYRLHLIPHSIADILNKDYFFVVPLIECRDRKSLFCRFDELLKKIRGMLWYSCIDGTRIPTQIPPENGFFITNLMANKKSYPQKSFVEDEDCGFSDHESIDDSFTEHLGCNSHTDSSDEDEDSSGLKNEILKDNMSHLLGDSESLKDEDIDNINNTNGDYQEKALIDQNLKGSGDSDDKSRAVNSFVESDDDVCVDEGEDSVCLKEVTDYHGYNDSNGQVNNSVHNNLDSCEEDSDLENFDKKFEIKVKSKNSKNIKCIPSLKFYVRENITLTAHVLPAEKLKTYQKFPSLFELEKLPLSERRNLFYRFLGFESLQFKEKLPDNIEFIFLCLCYCKLRFEIHTTGNNIFSMLLCLIMFNVIDGKVGRVRSKKTPESAAYLCSKIQAMKEAKSYKDPSTMSISELIRSLTVDECKLANFSLYKFHQSDPSNRRHNYHRIRMHAFSEYQATIYFLSFLNSILYFPYPVVPMSSIWSGTFNYNIRKVFSDKVNLDHVLSTLFSNNDKFIHLFDKMYSVLQIPLDLPELSIGSAVTPRDKDRIKGLRKQLGIKYNAQRSSSTKKKQKKARVFKMGSHVEECDKLENPTEEDLMLMAENKFSALLLCDTKLNFDE